MKYFIKYSFIIILFYFIYKFLFINNTKQFTSKTSKVFSGQIESLNDNHTEIPVILSEKKENIKNSFKNNPNEDVYKYGFCADELEDKVLFKRPYYGSELNKFLNNFVKRINDLNSRLKDNNLSETVQMLIDGRLKEIPNIIRELNLRNLDDYDYVFASRIIIGVKSLSKGYLNWAADYSALIIKDYPNEKFSYILKAVIANRRNDKAGERNALLYLYKDLDYKISSIALSIGKLFSHTKYLDISIESLTEYLNEYKADKAMFRLRARLIVRRDIQINFKEYSRDNITILYTPMVLTIQVMEFSKIIVDSFNLAANLTKTDIRPELTVIIYNDKSELLATTCVATWAGGVYDGTIRLYAEAISQLKIFREHIVHEVFHAQLHHHVKKVPYWLNEGLAQLFAGQFKQSHKNSYEKMIKNETFIPFSSMNARFSDFKDSEDANLAYHQSLAMVKMIIDYSSDQVIPDILNYLKNKGIYSKLLINVTGVDYKGSHLLEYLKKWKESGWE